MFSLLFTGFSDLSRNLITRRESSVTYANTLVIPALLISLAIKEALPKGTSTTLIGDVNVFDDCDVTNGAANVTTPVVVLTLVYATERVVPVDVSLKVIVP